MARGLTHPTAHIGKPLIDLDTKQEYVYEGFQFFQDLKKLPSSYSIFKEINKSSTVKSAALFKFNKSNKKFGILYYARSVTSSTKINAGTFNMQYAGRKGATENLGITSDTLIKGGRIQKRMLNGLDVNCAVFSNKAELGNSILKGLKGNNKVNAAVYDTVQDYLNSDLTQFGWKKGIQESDVNELGKYLGELVIGVCVLGKKFSPVFSENIFAGKQIKEFIVPDDPSFSGVDSAFVKNDGSLIPISSKLGAGAKASVFTNLLPKVMTSKKGIGDCVIKQIADSAKKIGITVEDLNAKRGAKDIVYEYGVRKILKLSQLEVPDPYQVFRDIKQNPNKLSKPAKAVVDAIKKHPDIEENVKAKLPYSVTSAFSREIARRLNNDETSKKIITEILAGKNFYQANLDVNKWKKGEVFFKLLLSGDANVGFIGSKAAIDDLEAKQGLVNYELKYS
jgi:hypothetical protein